MEGNNAVIRLMEGSQSWSARGKQYDYCLAVYFFRMAFFRKGVHGFRL